MSSALPNRNNGHTNGQHHAKSDAEGEPSADGHPDLKDGVIKEIFQALQGLQFGEVTITVREGRIVQIERIARKRQFLPKRP